MNIAFIILYILIMLIFCVYVFLRLKFLAKKHDEYTHSNIFWSIQKHVSIFVFIFVLMQVIASGIIMMRFLTLG